MQPGQGQPGSRKARALDSGQSEALRAEASVMQRGSVSARTSRGSPEGHRTNTKAVGGVPGGNAHTRAVAQPSQALRDSETGCTKGGGWGKGPFQGVEKKDSEKTVGQLHRSTVPTSQHLSMCLLRQINPLHSHELAMTGNCRL